MQFTHRTHIYEWIAHIDGLIIRGRVIIAFVSDAQWNGVFDKQFITNQLGDKISLCYWLLSDK